MKNIISIVYSAERLARIDTLIDQLVMEFNDLETLETDDIRRNAKMGPRSETFSRGVLMALQQNPGVVPPNLDVAEMGRDMAALDALRPRFIRLQQLMERADDTEIALGIDVYAAALEGYRLLDVAGRGESLKALRQALSARFARRRPAADAPADSTPVPTA